MAFDNHSLATLELAYGRPILPSDIGAEGVTSGIIPALFLGTWPVRPEGGTAITVIWLDPLGSSTVDPSNAFTGDILIKGAAS